MNNRYGFRVRSLFFVLIFLYTNQTKPALEAIRYICWNTCAWIGREVVATLSREAMTDGHRRIKDLQRRDQIMNDIEAHIRANATSPSVVTEGSKSAPVSEPVQQTTVGDAQQANTSIANPSAPSSAVQGVSNQPSSAKPVGARGGLVMGGTDVEKQFLQPGQRQPYDDNQPIENRRFYYDDKGNVCYQTSAGNTNISVGTDVGSILRFGKDVGEVIFADDGRPKTVSERIAAKENALFAQLSADRKEYQATYASYTTEQLAARKA